MAAPPQPPRSWWQSYTRNPMLLIALYTAALLLLILVCRSVHRLYAEYGGNSMSLITKGNY